MKKDGFIGRDRELEALEREYSRSGFGMFVLYGRRRVGKSTLIRKFIEGKRAVAMTAVKSDFKRNMALLRSTVPDSYRTSTEPTAEDVLDSWAAMSEDGRLIVVIDEYPYLANSFLSFSSILQNRIDVSFTGCDMFIILCGSSIGAMEDGVLGYESPLYGRRTAQMMMSPLTYLECRPYLDGFSELDCLRIYGMVGGIPAYLKMFDSSRGLDRCVIDNFLRDTAFFRLEPDYILREELRDPSTFSSLIAALANGKARLNEIADDAGISTSLASAKLSELVRLQIVEKTAPFGEASKKKTGYVLSDNMFRFCYRFVYGSYVPIDSSEEEASVKRIMSGMQTYMGHVFESACRMYARRNMGFNSVGTWWGSDPATKESAEIDVIAYDQGDPDGTVLFGECNCRSSPMAIEELDHLMKSSMLVRCRERRYALFSAGGFSESVVLAAEEQGIALIGLEDLYSPEARRCHSAARHSVRPAIHHPRMTEAPTPETIPDANLTDALSPTAPWSAHWMPVASSRAAPMTRALLFCRRSTKNDATAHPAKAPSRSPVSLMQMGICEPLRMKDLPAS